MWVICLIAMALSFLSAYFLPHPWGLLLVFVICGIGGALLRHYIPDVIETIVKDIEEQEKPQ
jgi:hypothetical protein